MVMLKFNSTLRQKVVRVICGKSFKVKDQTTTKVFTVTKTQSVAQVVKDELSEG